MCQENMGEDAVAVDAKGVRVDGLGEDDSTTIGGTTPQDGAQFCAGGQRTIKFGRKSKRVTVAVEGLTEDKYERLEKLMGSKDSTVFNGEVLMKLLEAEQNEKDRATQMRKNVGYLMGIIVVLLACTFASSTASVFLAKDAYVEENGNMQTSGGDIVRVANPDFTIGSNGDLVLRNPSAPVVDATGNLEAETEPHAVAVRRAVKPRQLKSVIPTSYFQDMEKVSLTIDNHELSFQVVAVSRQSTGRSKCGSLVHIQTGQGRITLDDDDVLISSEMESYVAGLGISVGDAVLTAQGRRLSASTGAMAQGLFSFFDSYSWTCDSEAKPNDFSGITSYRALKRIEFPCGHNGSTCESMIPGQALKAGAIDSASTGGVQKLQGTVETYWWKDNGVVSFTKYANHPTQTKVNIVDFTTQKETEYQVHADSGLAAFCTQEDNTSTTAGAPAGAFDESKVYLEFLGRAAVADRGTAVAGAAHTATADVPVRMWRISPREGHEATEDTYVFYDQDSAEGYPFYIALRGSSSNQESEEWSTTTFAEFETNVAAASLQTLFANAKAGTSANGTVGKASSGSSCATILGVAAAAGGAAAESAIPKMISPVAEHYSSIVYYKGILDAQKDTSALETSRTAMDSSYGAYWGHVVFSQDFTNWQTLAAPSSRLLLEAPAAAVQAVDDETMVDARRLAYNENDCTNSQGRPGFTSEECGAYTRIAMVGMSAGDLTIDGEVVYHTTDGTIDTSSGKIVSVSYAADCGTIAGAATFSNSNAVGGAEFTLSGAGCGLIWDGTMTLTRRSVMVKYESGTKWYAGRRGDAASWKTFSGVVAAA